MDRGRGNFHRGGSYPKHYASPGNSSHGPGHYHSRGSHHDWSGSRDTSGDHSDRGFLKRKYDSSNDHRKQFDDGMYYGGGAPRKQYHSGSNNYEERSSDHHRSYGGNSSLSRGHSRHNYTSDGQRSQNSDSYYRHDQRFEEDRSYSTKGFNRSDRDFDKRGFSGSSRQGGRGFGSNRGRGRGANQSSHSSKEHRSSRKESQSPSQRNSSSREEVNEASPLIKKIRSDDPTAASMSSNKESEMQESKAEDMQSDKISLDTASCRTTSRDDGSGDNKVTIKEEPADGTKSSVDRRPRSRSGDGDRKESDRDGDPPRKNRSHDLPDHFIRLQCPHCHQRSITFKDYIDHLRSTRHVASLERLSQQHRISLSKLRARQRQEQQQMEAQSSRPSHGSRMNFCTICKLYHSESRPNHETTELHKIIKNFLMPYCTVCKMHFLSRMIYEKHVATLPHIKNKANYEKALERKRQEERSHRNSDGNEGGVEVELDLNCYTTLDAVGSVDGDGEDALTLEEDPVGRECIKKVEVHYCDVCQRYLSRAEPWEKVVELHCRTRIHHRAFEERQNGGDRKVLGEDQQMELMEDAQSNTPERQPADPSKNKEDWLDYENSMGDHMGSDDGLDVGNGTAQREDDADDVQ